MDDICNNQNPGEIASDNSNGNSLTAPQQQLEKITSNGFNGGSGFFPF